MYETFEKFENEPVVATKLIEACRNGVYQLTEDTMKANQEIINDLIERLPKKIEQFKKSKHILIPKYLKEILDYLKNY